MKFKIKSRNETVTLEKEQLLQLLLEKVTNNIKSDHELMVRVLGDYLEVHGLMKTSNILQLMAIAFSIGYYYKVFFIKNNVEVETDVNITKDSAKDSDESVSD